MSAQIFTDGNYQGIGNDGKVVPYGKLYVYDFYSGLRSTTYQDSASTITNTNPIILTASGKANVFLAIGKYNIILKTNKDAVVSTLNGYTVATFGSQDIMNVSNEVANNAALAKGSADSASNSALSASNSATDAQSIASALGETQYAITQMGITLSYINDGDLIMNYASPITNITMTDGDITITY